jgi:hypothetical protein
MANIKTLTVDLDDPSDIKKQISYLQKKRKQLLEGLGYNGCLLNGNKVHLDSSLDLLQEFLKNISIVTGDYYVYAHCNPTKKLEPKTNAKDAWLLINYPHLPSRPFYIGKGTGSRYKNLTRNDSHRKIRSSLLKQEKDVVTILLINGISEQSALAIEEALIDVLGIAALSPHNFLVNLDEGSGYRGRRASYSKEQLTYLKSNKFIL